MSTLGERLRQTRESKGFSVEDLSRVSKISTRFILALETDDLAGLPGGVFNRGFIKSYTKYCGVDERPFLDEYDTFLKQMRGPELSTLAAAGKSSEEEEKSRGLFVAVLIVVVVLVVASAFLYYRSNRRRAAIPADETNTSQTSPSGAPGQTSGPSPVGAQNSSVPPVLPQPKVNETTLTESAPGIPARAEPQTTASNAPISKPATRPGTTAGRQESASETSAPITTKTALLKPPEDMTATTPSVESGIPAGARPFNLQIVAKERTWLSIKRDGKEVYRKILMPNETLKFSARDKFDIICGNAGGVALSVDGKPVASLGKSGEVKSVSFERPPEPSPEKQP